MRGAERGRAAARLALCLALLAAQALPARAISPAEEVELGRRFDLAARQKLPLIEDPDIVGYVEAIGRRIVSRLDGSSFQYHFSVLREGGINAFAVPGGYIYVHSGLLSRTANDDELASVLGHEIAHVHAHHLARQQEATQLLNYATLLGVLLSVIQPSIGAVASAANSAVQLKYRREFEQEADYMGARFVREAGYDPHGMLDFFKKLADEQRITPTFLPPYLLSHPLTDERLNHLEAVLRTPQWSGAKRPAPSIALLRAQVVTRVRSESPVEVTAAYRRQLENTPADALARYLYGLACLEAGQIESARTALEEARAAGVVAATRELGRLALRLRRLDEAKTSLSQAVKDDPGDLGAYLDLARTEEARGDASAALAAYRRAVEISPNLEPAQRGLAIVAGRSGDETGGLYHLATANRLRGDYRQALAQYTRVEALLPVGDARAEDVRNRVVEIADFLRVRAPEEPTRAPEKKDR